MKNRLFAAHVTFAAMLARGACFAPDAAIEAPLADAPETLADEFARLQDEARDVFSKAKKEARGLTDDEQSAQDKRYARLQEIGKLSDAEAKFAKLAFSGASAAEGDDEPAGQPKVQLPNDPARKASFSGKPKIDRDEFAKAASDWAFSGTMAQKFATITTATQSGIYLPREIGAAIVPTTANTLRQAIAIQGMEKVSIVNTPTTADLKVPVATGSAGGIVAENASSETENTPSLTESISLTASTYQSGSVYYSNLLLSAGAVDVVNNVVPTLQYEKELGLESTAIASIIADSGITQAVTLTGTTAAGLTYDKLVDLNRKVSKRFDAKKVILLSDDAYSAAEKLKDTAGNPILNRDAQNQELLRFNGTPVLRCSYLEAFAASKVVGVLVSLIGFRLRDVNQPEQLTRYTQVPGKPNQTGFNLFAYHAVGYAPSAMVKLVTSAS